MQPQREPHTLAALNLYHGVGGEVWRLRARHVPTRAQTRSHAQDEMDTKASTAKEGPSSSDANNKFFFEFLQVGASVCLHDNMLAPA